jgi:hypothetical protein
MKKLLIALVASLSFQLAWAAADATAPAMSAVKGEVLEVKDVDIYTYLRLKTANGEVWAAVTKAPVKKGAQVTIDKPMVMRNFESKTLKKTFDTIVFGTLGPANGAAPPTAAAASGKSDDLGKVHGNVVKTPNTEVAKVAKAPGADGRTVAQVNAERLALKGKTVSIHAKVVKVTPGIMGRNWIHLRDGSGSAADQSNDLLVTSKDRPKLGDVVTAKGVVNTDVNLGAGYTYKVLVENVTFAP